MRFLFLFIILNSCGTTSSQILGKWISKDSNTLFISDFQDNGLVYTYYYDLSNNKKVNSLPIIMKYEVIKENKDTYLEFTDLNDNKSIKSIIVFKGNDSIINFSKETYYNNNDSIVKNIETLLTRVNPRESNFAQ